jgi:hypothetical protein
MVIAEVVYQTTYITRNYHGNPVKLKKSIRLLISPGITMAMLDSIFKIIAGDIGSLIDFFSFTGLPW